LVLKALGSTRYSSRNDRRSFGAFWAPVARGQVDRRQISRAACPETRADGAQPERTPQDG
jgi:hypothetical protein